MGRICIKLIYFYYFYTAATMRKTIRHGRNNKHHRSRFILKIVIFDVALYCYGMCLVLKCSPGSLEAGTVNTTSEMEHRYRPESEK